MTPTEASAILEIPMPTVSGKTQEEVEARLQEWKSGALKQAWRAASLRYHPDRNADPSAAALFTRAGEAYAVLIALRIQLRRPQRLCPAGHPRTPLTANFCHECGFAFGADPLIRALRRGGLTATNIALILNSPDAEKLRANLEKPVDFQIQLRILQQRQRLGLFGQHSGWPK